MAAHPPTEPMVAAEGKGSVATKSLAEILNSSEDVEDGATSEESDRLEDDNQDADVPPAEGYCIECEGVFTFMLALCNQANNSCRPACGRNL